MQNCYKSNFNSINENKSEKELICNQSKTQNDFSRFNKTRTNLLLVANEELNKLKKSCITRINDKTLSTAEKEFTSQNNQIVSLKSEFFHPFTNNRQAFFTNKSNNFFFNSPDDSTRVKNRSDDNYSADVEKREFSSNTKVSDMDVSYSPSPKKIVEKKKSIFKKKDEYFKSVTLKIFKEEQVIESNRKNILHENNKNSHIKSKSFSNKNSKAQNYTYDNLYSIYIQNLKKSLNLPNFVNINKKKKMELANTGFKYLHDLCRRIKLKHKRRVFYSSGEKDSLIKQKQSLGETDYDEMEIQSSTSNNRVQLESLINNVDKTSLLNNIITDDNLKSRNNAKIIQSKTKSSVKNKIPKYHMRENNHSRFSQKIAEVNLKTDIANLHGNLQSEVKDLSLRPRKQMIPGLSKSNNRENSNVNQNPQNQNLNHSYNHNHKKEEFFIKLYKC